MAILISADAVGLCAVLLVNGISYLRGKTGYQLLLQSVGTVNNI